MLINCSVYTVQVPDNDELKYGARETLQTCYGQFLNNFRTLSQKYEIEKNVKYSGCQELESIVYNIIVPNKLKLFKHFTNKHIEKVFLSVPNIICIIKKMQPTLEIFK